MRSIITGVFLCFFLPEILAAQDLPRLEIFAGFSYFRVPSGFSPDNYVFTLEKASLNGWNLAATCNLNRWIGAEADFGGYYGTANALYWHAPSGGYFVQDIDIRSYLFGPRLSYRGDRRFTPFTHALFGEVVLARTPVGNTSQPSFGLALGGGLDVDLVRRVAIRAIQADYVSSSLTYRGENNLRLSVGVVLRF
jgi:hypothetical protein